jgi:hypothetical protein
MPNDIEMANKPPTCYWFVNLIKNKIRNIFCPYFLVVLIEIYLKLKFNVVFVFDFVIMIVYLYQLGMFLFNIIFFLFVLIRPMLPFMTNYQFLCKDCSPMKPEEQFIKKTASKFPSKKK